MAVQTMKAVRLHEFGGPEVLVLDEVPRPEPGPGEVLVEVRAAGVNPADLHVRDGFARIPAELRTTLPLPFIPGSDVSGVVAAVGPGVTAWSVGDAVFGLIRFPGPGRAYAEYLVAPEDHLAAVPAGTDHVHAAAAPMAALTAHQFLFDHVGVERGRTILVNGAAGGVGHYLVQLAKVVGAHVIGVASGRHERFLLELGVDRFVDYTTTDVRDAARDVDHVFDAVGGPNGHRLLPVLKPGGTLSPIFLGEYHREEAAAKGVTFPSRQVRSDGPGMAAVARLMAEGRLRSTIDQVFPLADARKAHEHVDRGHLQGKVVLRVG